MFSATQPSKGFKFHLQSGCNWKIISSALRVWADALANLPSRARWFAYQGNVTGNGNQAGRVSPLIRRGLFHFRPSAIVL